MTQGFAAASGGFADGGFTGYGGRNEFAGPAHKGEVIFSQDDVSRHGGPAAVETLRVNGPSAYARFDAATVGSSQPGLASASAGGRGSSSSYSGAPAAKPQIFLFRADTQEQFRAIQRLPGYEVSIVDVLKRNAGEIFES